jgi:hypothetical protein
MIFYWLIFALTQAHALEFSSYPTTPLEAECHPLDFRSTSQARNAEELIRKNNPDRSRANYAGKYLLLKAPYMMETEWLIADCASGKFFKDTATGEAEFKPESALIRITRDRNTFWMHWTGDTFTRIEDTRAALPVSSPSASPEALLEQRYSETFKQHSAESPGSTCAPLDFRTYFRAQQAEGQIRKSPIDLRRANFAGSFLLIQVELLFETIVLVADCKTGKFFQDFRSGKMLFKNQSRMALLLKKNASPELLEWIAPEWIRRPDPTLNEPQEVENELRGDPARTLLSLIPNPLKRSKVEFKDLLCRIGSGNSSGLCSLELDDPKAPEKRFTISGETAKQWIRLVERYGVRSGSVETGLNFAVQRGFCNAALSSCSLFLR